MPRINYNSLLVGNARGWHDGSDVITYSFLGTSLPKYYAGVDTDYDGIVDARDVDGAIVSLDQDVSMTTDERAMASLAIAAWNEVANVHLVPGTVDRGATETVEGTEITGDGTLVDAGGVAVPTNDDGYAAYDFSAVFEEGMNFFGVQYDATEIYVNTNGSISFDTGISTYTPTSISAGTTAMIAPFWADVDTRVGSPIYVDVDEIEDVVTVTWQNVGYYAYHTDLVNSFQLQLYDRGGGDFDIVFRYESINWTTGDASDGAGGLGGNVAHAGYSAGNGADFFELPQSDDQAGILALDSTVGNTGVTGLWVFEVRDGALYGDITFGSTEFTDEYGDLDTGLFGFIAGFPRPDVLGDRTTKHGDLWINSANPDQEATAYGHTSWQTYLHELGHALGLHHPDEDPNNDYFASNNNNQWTVMSYLPHPSVEDEDMEDQPYPLTPMVLDIQAMQSLYGANLTTRTDDTVYFGDGDGTYDLAYQYAADNMKVDGGDDVMRDVILTIWDAGGQDLIDASDLSTRVLIDLRPGKFSTIGEVQNNIGLAAAVRVDGEVVNYIEDAEGGSARDRLVGNNGDNVLSGNDGNDVLKGLSGDDELYGDAGRDILRGGKGADTLNGGEGRDVLYGNGQSDVFLFEGDTIGADTIRDFRNDVDEIWLDELLWGGGLDVAEVVDLYAFSANGRTVFDFGEGNTISLRNVSDADVLVDDIVLLTLVS
ncbi:hypothetical protein HJ526_17860 [Donghicola sp. C2-DW-16]|uniref:NIDO domain-containing protein n=1 Tax=Donghicola mangrovi TaxID=2729614 RepID=A0ABX2PIE4_9RHOB|nr:nidogen-like domain-containing protein [Donghicola mangrovi]NVO29290.1 hypothetical protein [Donghicola mangrovi]